MAVNWTIIIELVIELNGVGDFQITSIKLWSCVFRYGHDSWYKIELKVEVPVILSHLLIFILHNTWSTDAEDSMHRLNDTILRYLSLFIRARIIIKCACFCFVFVTFFGCEFIYFGFLPHTKCKFAMKLRDTQRKNALWLDN